MKAIPIKRSTKVAVVLFAALLALVAAFPVIGFAADQTAQGAEAKVQYEHRGDTSKWVANSYPGTVSDPVYCVQPTRSPSSDGWNADYRYRWNLSANSWLLDNNRRSLENNTYAIDSGELEKLAKILYVGFGHDAAGLGSGVSDSDFYKATQNAVFWVICYGKDNAPNYAGKSYKKGLAGQLIEAAKNVTLPSEYTLYMYVPDSDSAGNLQNTVNLKVGASDTPSTPSGADASVTVRTKKAFVNGELGPEPWHQFGFRLEDLSHGDNYYYTRYNDYEDVYFSNLTYDESNVGETYNFNLYEVTDPAAQGMYDNWQIFDDITYDKDSRFNLSYTINKEGDTITINVSNPANNVFAVETTESGTEKLVALQDGDDIAGKVVQVGKFTNYAKKMKTTVTAGGKTASEESPANLTADEASSAKTVIDKIEYSGLTGGATYEVKGELYEVVDGEISGSAIATATEDKTADSTGAGTWEVKFTGVNLEPGKKYVVYETATNKNDSSETLEHKDASDNSQAIVVGPELRTTVSANGEPATVDNGARVNTSEDKVTVNIVDVINHKGLTPGATYNVTYTVRNVTDGVDVKSDTVACVAVEGVPWRIEIGSVELEAGTDGKKYVIYEKAVNVDDENDVIVHEDDNDLSQVINVNRDEELSPDLSTTVSAGGQTASENKAVELSAEDAKSVTTVVDTVKYEGLKQPNPGEEYSFEGTLMKIAEDGTATAVAGPVAQQLDYSKPAGTIEIVFDGVTLEPGTKYVVYETLKSGSTTLKEHKNPNDTAQTIVVEEAPKPEIKNTTISADGKDGSDSAPVEVKLSSGSEVEIKDNVELSNVKEGTYTIAWTLVNKADSTEKNSGTEQVNVLSDGELTTEINLGTLDAAGEYTIRTELYEGTDTSANPVSTHNGDFQTTRETVKVTERTNVGKLATTVSSGDKSASSTAELQLSAEEASGATVTDTITYEGMDGGFDYLVIGTLNEVEDGKVVKAVKTAQATLTADASGKGTWTLDFTDVTLEAGKKYVVYEYAENTDDSDDNAEHKNPNDKAQTIMVTASDDGPQDSGSTDDNNSGSNDDEGSDDSGTNGPTDGDTTTPSTGGNNTNETPKTGDFPVGMLLLAVAASGAVILRQRLKSY